MLIKPYRNSFEYRIQAGNGANVTIQYPEGLVYHFEDEVRQFFAELHIPKELTERFIAHYRESGDVDYRTFLEKEVGATIDKDFWRTYRLDYGMGNEPCQLGGGNAFICSVDQDGDVVVLMLKRRIEAPETFHRYSPVGGGYRNWRYRVDGKEWCACEPSYLTAMRECKEESGKNLDCSTMVFFNRENATSYPNGQVVDHAESIFYIVWTDFSNLRGYLGSSYEGNTLIVKVKDLGNYPVFTACKLSVRRLMEQYGE